MTGYCVKGKHQECPDTDKDTYTCNCPCHLGASTADAVAAALRKAADEQT